MSTEALSTREGMRIEIVADDSRLAEIGPAWTELWKRSDGLIFQSHAWVSAWWQTLADREHRELRIGLVWQGERLDAVMALATQRRRGLTLLEWAAKDSSDYCDFLAAPDCSSDTLNRLWSTLRNQGGFDVALVGRLLPDARGWCLKGDQASRLRPNHRTEVSHRVVSQLNGESWFKAQSKKARKNFRRHWKLLEENGPVNFRLLGPDEPRKSVIDQFLTMKRNWLKSQGLSSAAYEQDAEAVIRMIDALADAGLLHLFVLESNDHVAAVAINFMQRGTMMAFLTAYDPAYERASPGTILITEYIMWAYDNGLSTVDFLCGGEAFKARFGTDAAVLGTLACAGSFKGQIALATDSARHRLMELRSAAKQWLGRLSARAGNGGRNTDEPDNPMLDAKLETQQ